MNSEQRAGRVALARPHWLSAPQEVPMIPRPHYAQPGCVYFICLLRDDLLLRQGACTGLALRGGRFLLST